MFLQELYIFLHMAILEYLSCGDTQIAAADFKLLTDREEMVVKQFKVSC